MELAEIYARRNNCDAVGIDPTAHQRTVMLGDGNDVIEVSDGLALVSEHLAKFQSIHLTFDRMGFGVGVATPDFAFDVVLEERGRNR